MTYKQTSIVKVIEEIDKHNILLPSIQRKFVWDEEGIIKLMDSIMRGYPFGTFLFWRIKKEAANNRHYLMYEFIKNYHERDSAIKNDELELHPSTDEDEVISVLDGQQRLASLYIATMGSLRLKIPKKRWKDDGAFPEKELYLDLLGTNQDETDELKYAFKFLSQEEFKIEQEDNTKCWYKVKDIMHYSNLAKIKNAAKRKGITTNKTTKTTLTILYRRLTTEKLINYYEVVSNSMNDVLDIFVRANSGGIELSKTDLLFSTVAAQWKEARREIDKFLKSVSEKPKNYFKFNTDFIMRACLYTLDMPILMKVENFNQSNIEQIKNNWDDIKSAILDVIKMLDEQGFSTENIISNNAILPIIYYRFKKGSQALKDLSIKNDFRKYFVLAQIKKIFGSHSNQVLDILRNEINKLNIFSYEGIKNISLPDEKSLSCKSSDIEDWLEEFKKGAQTFFLLSLLYPEKKFNQGTTYEQDHMHPYAGFKRSELKKLVLENGAKLSEKQIKDWEEKRDTLPNLELLTDAENEEKSDDALSDWVSSGHHDNYLPKGKMNNYEFWDFEHFYEERKTLLKNKLESILIK